MSRVAKHLLSLSARFPQGHFQVSRRLAGRAPRAIMAILGFVRSAIATPTFCSRCRLAFVAVSVGIAAALNCGLAMGQTSSWIAGSGDWSTDGNWSPSGVPANAVVQIINSDSVNRTITLDSGGITFEAELTIDQTGSGSDSLVASNGSLSVNYLYIGNSGQGSFTNYGQTVTADSIFTLGNNAGSSGTFNNYGTLNLGGMATETVGNFGSGTINSTGSNIYASGLVLGAGASGSGTYNLSGVLNGFGSEVIGAAGAGIFNQTAFSSNNVGNELDIAFSSGSTGNYTIGGNGATLTVNGGLYVGGSSYAGPGGAGTLTVGAGGTVTVGGTLQIYPGAANSVVLNGGTISAGSFVLDSISQLQWNSGTISFTNLLQFDSQSGNFSGGSLTLQTGQTLVANGGENIGYSGTGFFTQNGGTHTLTGPSELVLGYNPGSAGTYNLNGGLLSAVGSVSPAFLIGYSGTGTVNQTGGAAVVGAGGLILAYSGNSQGAYNLSGGSLTSAAEQIGISPLSSGAFNQSGGTNTTAGLLLGNSGQGAYTLSGGVLAVNGSGETVGSYSGVGIFSQSGGTNVISGSQDLSIGIANLGPGASGTYTLSGGYLSVSGGVYLGGTRYGPGGGTGTLNVDENSAPSSLLTVAGTLTVYPGGMVNFRYGDIQTGALDLGGNYSAFNWSIGTLELTNTNVVLDSTVVGVTNPLGAALVIGGSQTLIVDLNETIGGVGPGSLTVNGAHIVGGTLTLNSDGTLTVGPSGSLSFGSFVQAGGVVSGTITNTGSYTYQAGLFNGRLINQGTVNLGNNFIAGNGIENDDNMNVAAGQRLTVGGQGFDNLGSFTLSGGTIFGLFTNDYGGTMTAFSGSINQPLTNNGTLNVAGVLTTGGVANDGQITISAGANLRTFASPNSGTFINDAGGVVQGGGGAISMVFMNTAGGRVVVPAGNSLSITGPWTNSGLVSLQGNGAVLNGGTITNTATVSGIGEVSATLLNAGVVGGSSGELDLGGTGNTNTASGDIEAGAGSTVVYLQGLASNSGTIALSGGTFDNNVHPMANASGANIVGSGTLKTGGLTNAGSVFFADNPTSVYGAVTTATGGTFTISNNTTTFFGAVTVGSGSTFTTNKATARFLSTFTNDGTYVSDPSTAIFTSAVVDATGTIEASLGDLYQVTGNFTNASTQSSTWNASGATLEFSGGGSHTLNVSGPVGSYSWGTLIIAAGNTLQIAGNSATTTATNNAGTINQTAGSASLGIVSGNGNLNVGNGSVAANLTATQILQTTLTIGVGSTVTIAPSGPGMQSVAASDSTASDGPVVSGEALAAGSSDSNTDSSDPFLVIQAAIASGAISNVKGEQLENRIAAIERLAAADAGLDVSLLEDRVLASLPSSVWSSSDSSESAEWGSSMLGMDDNLTDSGASGAPTAFSSAAGIGGSPAAVPEPSTLLLAALGGIGLTVLARHSRKLRHSATFRHPQ
jgi:hypothetical protein